MWKLAKLLLLALIILMIGFRLLHKEDIFFRIYTANNRSIYSLLGFLPPHLKDDFVKMPIERNSNGTLYIVANKYQDWRYIVYANQDEENLLVAWPPELVNNNFKYEDQKVDEYHQFMINLEVFNTYIMDSQTRDRELIKYKYVELIAKGNSNFYVIKDTLDLRVIKSKFTDFYESNTIVKADLDPMSIVNDPSAYYCWYINSGVVKFSFLFEGNRVVKVHSKQIGYLGNEFIPI